MAYMFENQEEKDMKEWIDNASYESLLSKRRFAPSPDPYFIGEVGDYYSQIMREKKAKLCPGEAVAISKRLSF